MPCQYNCPDRSPYPQMRSVVPLSRVVTTDWLIDIITATVDREFVDDDADDNIDSLSDDL